MYRQLLLVFLLTRESVTDTLLLVMMVITKVADILAVIQIADEVVLQWRNSYS